MSRLSSDDSFASIARSAIENVDRVLAQYLPGGQRRGPEYVVKNPLRSDARPGSFSVNTETGVWADFAIYEKGGDLISLVAYLTSSSQKQAALALTELLGVSRYEMPRTASPEVRAEDLAMRVMPVPVDGPPVPAHFKLGRPTTAWAYKKSSGEVLFWVCRFDRPDGGKNFLPATLWCVGERLEWRWKGPVSPRPLYGLDRLATLPCAQVLVCEGEKAADAAQRLLSDWACITSLNGAQSASKADWSPLKGRSIVIWPDADSAGESYASAVSRLVREVGATSVRILDVAVLQDATSPGLPAGFDAADFEADGFPLTRLRSALSTAPQAAQENPAKAWPAMQPIKADLKPVPAFDGVALLPEPLRTWVLDEAHRKSCSPDFVAAAALVALGSTIGARCAIKPKSSDSWVVVPNLWGCIVGPPSVKKSPACSAGMEPLSRLAAAAVTAHERELIDFNIEKLTFTAQREGLEGRIKAAAKEGKADSKAEASLRSHCEQEPRPPVPRRYKTNDATVEKLGELLRDNPAGQLVLRDELVGLLAGWEMEGHERDRAFFLEAWNGTQGFDVDRIARGHISIPNLCVSIFGGTQPDKLVGYLESATNKLGNDGMLQRFQVLVYPDPNRWSWVNEAPNRDVRASVMELFEALASFNPTDWGASPADESTKFPHYKFSVEAQALFADWSRELNTERIPQEEDPLIQQHLAKYEKLLPALALIFHLIEGAGGSPQGLVSAQIVWRAAAWCEYLEAHARRCYGLLRDDGLRSAEALAKKLERGELNEGFTLREVRRNQWRSLTTDDAVAAAAEWLEDAGWIIGELSGGAGPGSGRRTTRYRIHPALPRLGRRA